MNKGIVVKVESKDYYIRSDSAGSVIRCSTRGRLKKDFHLKKDKLYQTDIAAVGDHVLFDLLPDGTGAIHSILPRQNFLSRKAPRAKGAGYRGERLEQIVAANIGLFVAVVSAVNPLFNNKVLDRFLVIAASAGITSLIVINKTDLVDEELLEPWVCLYRGIGYQVFPVSCVTGDGIAGLLPQLQGNRTLIWGQSGVGKSSLINALYPEFSLITDEVSGWSGKGKHTTVTALMLETSPGTFIIDTPGVREIDPFGVRREDLSHFFPEFVPELANCRFASCTHNHEPDCAVLRAVEQGLISPERYDSYLRLLETVETGIHF